MAALAAGGAASLLLLGEGWRYACFALALCGGGLAFAHYLCFWLLAKDEGTAAMRDVATPIREGAEAFLRTQYGAIAQLAALVAIGIFAAYQMRPSDMAGGVNSLSSGTLGMLAAGSFLAGAGCSAAAGYVSMVIAARTNIRVASAARRSYLEALAICFRGGAFSAILVLALCVAGVTTLHTALYAIYADDFEIGSGAGVAPGDIPMLCVGCKWGKGRGGGGVGGGGGRGAAAEAEAAATLAQQST